MAAVPQHRGKYWIYGCRLVLAQIGWPVTPTLTRFSTDQLANSSALFVIESMNGWMDASQLLR